MGLYTLHLFAGAGGGILADMLQGNTPIGAVEIEEYPRKILLQRQLDGILPAFPVWDDVTTFRADNPETAGFIGRCKELRNKLCICGGFPCQAFSTAAHGNNTAKNLWPKMLRVIGEIFPRFVFAENVSEDAIVCAQRDIEKCGYKTARARICAKDMGADHVRERWWLFANSDNNGELGSSINAKMEIFKDCRCRVWETFPGNPRMDNGMANRMDRFRAIGNGQVPQVAKLAWEILSNEI